MRLRGFFTDHPTSVGESYGEHFVFAIRFARATAGASLAAAVHAVFTHTCHVDVVRSASEAYIVLVRAARTYDPHNMLIRPPALRTWARSML